MFTSDATYKGTRTRKLLPGELERLEEAIEKIKARREERKKLLNKDD